MNALIPVSSSLETFTLQQMKAALANQVPGQRKARPRKVTLYATEMTTGRWKVNGDTIKFDDQGRLIDGQHRLMAAIQAGLTLTSFVARGLDADDAFATLDVGARRSTADYLRYHGFASNVALLAASARRFSWLRGSLAGTNSDTNGRRGLRSHSLVLEMACR